MKIVVIGSSNIDMIAQVNHLPMPGETVGQARFMQAYGGKGANQAVAAARRSDFCHGFRQRYVCQHAERAL